MSKRKIVVRDPETDEKTSITCTLSARVDGVCRCLRENGWGDVAGLIWNGKLLDGSKKLSEVGYASGNVLEVYREKNIVVWDPLQSRPITVPYQDVPVSKLVEHLKKKGVEEFDGLRYKGKMMNGKRLSDCGYEPGTRIEIYRRPVIVVETGEETRKLPYQNYTIGDLIAELGGSIELKYKGLRVSNNKTLEDIKYVPGEALEGVRKSVRQTLARKTMKVMAFDPLTGKSIPLRVITQKDDLVQDVLDAVKMTFPDALDVFYGGLAVDKEKSLAEIGYTDDTSFIVYRPTETPGLEVTTAADSEPDDNEAEYLERLRSEIPEEQYQDLTRIRFPDGFDAAMKMLFWDACGRDVREVQQRLLKL